jgi:hypothetical protein
VLAQRPGGLYNKESPRDDSRSSCDVGDQLHDNLRGSCDDRSNPMTTWGDRAMIGINCKTTWGACAMKGNDHATNKARAATWEHAHDGFWVPVTMAQEEHADEVSLIDIFGAPLKKNQGESRRIGGENASNRGTKEVCRCTFLKFHINSPNSENSDDLVENRARTKL